MASCLSLAAEASAAWILEIKRNSSRRPSELAIFFVSGFFLLDTVSQRSLLVDITPGSRNLARLIT